MSIYITIQYILLGLLSLATLYILFFAVAGLFYRQPRVGNPAKYRKMAIFIPGYKEDAVITEVAISALQQQYPMGMYDVVVIADSFR